MTSQRLAAIKRRLKKKGWSNRAAAQMLGVTFEHLNRVLNGHRESARLISSIEALPAREVASAR
jgi:transcriptional regulator with XRE-family HTH domain